MCPECKSLIQCNPWNSTNKYPKSFCGGTVFKRWLCSYPSDVDAKIDQQSICRKSYETLPHPKATWEFVPVVPNGCAVLSGLAHGYLKLGIGAWDLFFFFAAGLMKGFWKTAFCETGNDGKWFWLAYSVGKWWEMLVDFLSYGSITCFGMAYDGISLAHTKLAAKFVARISAWCTSGGVTSTWLCGCWVAGFLMWSELAILVQNVVTRMPQN